MLYITIWSEWFYANHDGQSFRSAYFMLRWITCLKFRWIERCLASHHRRNNIEYKCLTHRLFHASISLKSFVRTFLVRQKFTGGSGSNKQFNIRFYSRNVISWRRFIWFTTRAIVVIYAGKRGTIDGPPISISHTVVRGRGESIHCKFQCQIIQAMKTESNPSCGGRSGRS